MDVIINYYSKARNSFNMSEEEFNKELAYNQNRIVSKIVDRDKIRPSREILDQMEKFEQLINTKWLELQSMPEARRVIEPNEEWRLECANMYHEFQIPKHSGGFRTISAPSDELKAAQHTILVMMTRKLKYLPSNNAHGFTKHRNCKTALEVHQAKGSRWFLKMDIKDFFPNTTAEKLDEALKTTYPFCLMTACSRSRLIQICTVEGCLPQGAPTSPLLTNMVMGFVDKEINDYCKEHGYVYTRYADDILISSKYSFDKEEVVARVEECVAARGYELKLEKTRYGSFNGRNWNLGLMFNNQGKITVGHEKKHRVKVMLHNYLTKEDQHTEENRYKLIGIIGYCRYIEPEYFAPYMELILNN